MPASGEFTPLEMDRYYTGLVTQRNPLRDASVPYNNAKSYAVGRYDSIWDGLNVEITARLTLGRRPGNPVYNSQDFPPINRFYEHHIIIDGVASIRVMVDTALTVYDGTGPSTKNAIWTKSAGAGKTFFQSVGNTLFFTNGIDRKKWFVPNKGWKASTLFTTGDKILDSNGNIQVAFGAASAQVVSSSILNFIPAGGVASRSTVHLDLATPAPFANFSEANFAGLVAAGILNGQVETINIAGSSVSVTIFPAVTPYTTVPDSGIVYSNGTGNQTGTSGATVPTWATTLGAVTVDGGVRWINKGSAVSDWGTDGPVNAPTLNQAAQSTQQKSWQASTFYTAIPFILPATGGGVTLQQLIAPGITAAGAPAYSSTPGVNTTNGAAVYVCVSNIPTFATPGDGSWPTSTAVNTGAVIAVLLASGAYLMQATQGGVTGATQPAWPTAFGTMKTDNTVVWKNYGIAPPSAPLSTNTAIEGQILDDNGNIQSVTDNVGAGAWGTSGATVPTFATDIGITTADASLLWMVAAAFSIAFTDVVLYYYSYRNSVALTESNLSPASMPIMKLANNKIQVQGQGGPDPQDDILRIYRTDQGQALPLFLADIPMPPGGAAGIWTYDDTSSDADLNIFIQGAQNGKNNRPPLGMTALSYHGSRIWGIVNNLIYFATGPDEAPTSGNGNEAWAPGNVFSMPNSAIRSEPVTIDNGGMFVFTVSDIYAIRGDGTAGNPYGLTRYAKGIGLLNYDALDIIGATIHMQTTARKQISLDPSAGYNEVGQMIGDQFKRVTQGGFNAALYNPASTFTTWHESESGDTGLIVADGAVGWFRYAPTSAPETGFFWNPFAAIEGGTSAVQSVETSPGVKQLLIGPHGTGKILARDTSTHADNDVAYSNTYATIGSIQLCHPYELAEIGGIVLDSARIGTAPTCGLLFGEIKETANVPFDMLEKTGVDPPLLPESETLYSDRFDTLQNGFCILCRHLQLKIQWSVEDTASELLTHTLYVKVSSENP